MRRRTRLALTLLLSVGIAVTGAVVPGAASASPVVQSQIQLAHAPTPVLAPATTSPGTVEVTLTPKANGQTGWICAPQFRVPPLTHTRACEAIYWNGNYISRVDIQIEVWDTNFWGAYLLYDAGSGYRHQGPEVKFSASFWSHSYTSYSVSIKRRFAYRSAICLGLWQFYPERLKQQICVYISGPGL